MAFARNGVKHPPKKTKMFKITPVTFSCCITRYFDIPDNWTECEYNDWYERTNKTLCTPLPEVEP